MTKEQIKEKHGDLPTWLISLIMLLGEEVVSWLIEKIKKKRSKNSNANPDANANPDSNAN
jgi:NTP pyrophosphatase (non-canonical NTP hydrolase)